MKTKEQAPQGNATPTETPRRVVILMSKEAFKVVLEARPLLLPALKGHKPIYRRMGDGDLGLHQLKNDEVDADTLIVGFSIPTNLVARARKCIEIPLGKGVNRLEASSKIPDAPAVAALVKALAENGRIALTAYKVERVPVNDTEPDVPEEEEEPAFG